MFLVFCYINSSSMFRFFLKACYVSFDSRSILFVLQILKNFNTKMVIYWRRLYYSFFNYKQYCVKLFKQASASKFFTKTKKKLFNNKKSRENQFYLLFSKFENVDFFKVIYIYRANSNWWIFVIYKNQIFGILKNQMKAHFFVVKHLFNKTRRLF